MTPRRISSGSGNPPRSQGRRVYPDLPRIGVVEKPLAFRSGFYCRGGHTGPPLQNQPPLPPLVRGARKSKVPSTRETKKSPPGKRAKAKPPLSGGGASPFYTPLLRGGRGGWFSNREGRSLYPLKRGLFNCSEQMRQRFRGRAQPRGRAPGSFPERPSARRPIRCAS